MLVVMGMFSELMPVDLVILLRCINNNNNSTVKPFNLAALNFCVLPFVDILAAL